MVDAKSLYSTFSRYPRPALREADPESCSASSGFAARLDVRLRAKPLTDLTDSDLLDYYFSAVTVVGTVEGFKFYLPRILELMAFKPRPLLEPRVLVSRLHDARFSSWPEAERRAVIEFCSAAPPNSRLRKAAERLSEEPFAAAPA